MNWFALSLISAFSLASADAFTKRNLSDYSEEELVLVRFFIPALILSPILLFEPLPALPHAFWAWVACAVPLEILAMRLYVRAIRHSPLYLTLPYLAFTPIFTALLGYALLGEKIGFSGFAGILLITCGAFMLNLRHLGKGIFEPFRAIFREEGSKLMLLVAAIYGFTSVLGKGALQYCPPLAFGALYFLLVGTGSMALYVKGNPIRQLFRNPGWATLTGTLMAAMVASHFLAISLTKAAYMVAVKRTSLLFGVTYGAILFREKGFGLHFLAGVIMVAGVALISTMV